MLLHFVQPFFRKENLSTQTHVVHFITIFSRRHFTHIWLSKNRETEQRVKREREEVSLPRFVDFALLSLILQRLQSWVKEKRDRRWSLGIVPLHPSCSFLSRLNTCCHWVQWVRRGRKILPSYHELQGWWLLAKYQVHIPACDMCGRKNWAKNYERERGKKRKKSWKPFKTWFLCDERRVNVNWNEFSFLSFYSPHFIRLSFHSSFHPLPLSLSLVISSSLVRRLSFASFDDETQHFDQTYLLILSVQCDEEGREMRSDVCCKCLLHTWLVGREGMDDEKRKLKWCEVKESETVWRSEWKEGRMEADPLLWNENVNGVKESTLIASIRIHPPLLEWVTFSSCFSSILLFPHDFIRFIHFSVKSGNPVPFIFSEQDHNPCCVFLKKHLKKHQSHRLPFSFFPFSFQLHFSTVSPTNQSSYFSETLLPLKQVLLPWNGSYHHFFLHPISSCLSSLSF